MPTSTIDTFFACTIILAAALISTVFVGSSLQVQINDSHDLNKETYLKALADNLVNSPGTPQDWGTSNTRPIDLGLAKSSSQDYLQLDANKINWLANSTLTYPELAFSTTNLNDIGLKIRVSQMLGIEIEKLGNVTLNHITTLTFSINTNLSSRPTSASIHGYFITNNFLREVTNTTSQEGTCTLSIDVAETIDVNDAYLLVFARSPADNRITSYAIYNLNTQTQELSPSENLLTFNGPFSNNLSWTVNNSSLSLTKAEIFSFGYTQNISISQGAMSCTLPQMADPSPQIIILEGHSDANYVQMWTANPKVPLEIGANLDQSEQNIFSYLATIEGCLYRIEIIFGDINR
jgi:hypothetical protein